MAIDRRLIGLPARLLLRLITIWTFASGLAALVTAVFASMAGRQSRPGWLEPLFSIPMTLAVSLLPGAIASFALMPSATALERGGEQDDPPALFLVFVVGLCGIAAFELAPPIVAWWSENLAQVDRLFAFGSDPFGLTIIPAVLLVSMPLLASAAMLTFVLTSILTVVSRTDVTFRVLAACVALQVGLALAAYLLMDGLRDVGALVSHTFGSEPPSEERDRLAAQAAAWFSQQEGLADAVVRRLIWIVGGYAVALAASGFLTRRVAPGPVQAIPVAVTHPSGAAASAAPAAFDRSSYIVRPVLSLLSLFGVRCREYRIASIPPATGAGFSFSWSTGIVRGDGDGASVLALRVHERHWFAMSAYAVIDGPTGAPLGFLKPNWHDWEVVNPAGDTVARVVRQSVTAPFTRYVADVAGVEVCRFTWVMAGIGISTAELEVEFLPGGDQLFDRAFGIAVAPLLEEQVRRVRQRRH